MTHVVASPMDARAAGSPSSGHNRRFCPRHLAWSYNSPIESPIRTAPDQKRHINAEECNMKRRRFLSVMAAAIMLPIAFGMWNSNIEAKQPKPPKPNVSDPPVYVVDPFWPKPLPDNWVTG